MHITHTITIDYDDEAKKFSIQRQFDTSLLGAEEHLGALVCSRRYVEELREELLRIAVSAEADWKEYQLLPRSI